jgi:hypothetical protein
MLTKRLTSLLQKSRTPIVFVLIVFGASVSQPSFGQTIVCPEGSSLQVSIAVKEVRRYIYLRTGDKLPLKESVSIPEKGDLILIADDDNKMVESLGDSLGHNTHPGGFIIKTVKENSRQILVITGSDSISTLYGAYRFAEHLGIGFGLSRDAIPDKQITLDISGFDEMGGPLLKTRGILPFHDFPEGPDLWNTDDYMAVISQLVKLGMNFIGLHTYPRWSTTMDKDGNVPQGPEPTTWVGLQQDINADGTVKWSYPAYYAHTHRPDRIWGFAELDTDRFHAGASQLFESNGYGSDVIGEVMPADVQSSNEVFDRTGRMFRTAFTHARNLGVSTAIGTELPLGLEPKGPEVDYDWIRGMPLALTERLTSLGKDPEDPSTIKAVYKGIFERIKRTHPLDYYWLWSWEVWSRHGVSDEQTGTFKREMKLAYEALQAVDAPFQLALAGWIIGTADEPAEFDDVLPPQVPIFGLWDEAQGFEELSARRIKWPATWLEEDWGLAQPQMEAHRVYADARAALEKKCDGLIAKHWRTRILGANIGAMKDLLWAYGPTGRPLERKLPPNRNKWLDEFYRDWANRQFGPEAGPSIAELFAELEKKGRSGSGALQPVLGWDSDQEDSNNGAPGAIMSTRRPWTSERSKYGFVARLEGLRPNVSGVGNLERFDYWLSAFRCLRIMGEYATVRHRFEEAAEDEDWTEALAHRRTMARLWEDLMTVQIQKVSNSSDLGEIINLEILNWHQLVELKWDEQMKDGLGTEIPDDANPTMRYSGSPLMAVDAERSMLYADEPLCLKVRVMGNPDSVRIHRRSLGEGEYESQTLAHVARGVYALTLPPQPRDFEYYLEAQMPGEKIVHPVTAPNLNQTVIVVRGTEMTNRR